MFILLGSLYIACVCCQWDLIDNKSITLYIVWLLYTGQVISLVVAYEKAETCNCWGKLCKNSLAIWTSQVVWCGFDRASSLICGKKMPARCNRWFLLQILLLAQHVSGTTMLAREYYTSGCCLPYLVLWFSSCRYGVELRVVCLVCIILSSSWWWA